MDTYKRTNTKDNTRKNQQRKTPTAAVLENGLNLLLIKMPGTAVNGPKNSDNNPKIKSTTPFGDV
jgi:hypothetical protein